MAGVDQQLAKKETRTQNRQERYERFRKKQKEEKSAPLDSVECELASGINSESNHPLTMMMIEQIHGTKSPQHHVP